MALPHKGNPCKKNECKKISIMKLDKDSNDGSAKRIAKISAVVQRSYKDMAKDLNVSAYTLYNISASHDNITRSMAERIVSAYPRLNLEWVLNGEGEMLNGVRTYYQTAFSSMDDMVEVPIIGLDAHSLLPNKNANKNTNKNANKKANEVLIPERTLLFSKEFAKEGDLAMYVCGDAMAPKYLAGSLVLIRRVELWKDFLEQGTNYALELADGRRLLKTVKRGTAKDTLLLESINPDFPASEIPKKIIRNVYEVVLYIYRETL